jgi:hypothetical protein
MRGRFLMLLVAGLLGFAASTSRAQSVADPVLGTWRLNVERSRFTPGPGWRSQLRPTGPRRTASR